MELGPLRIGAAIAVALLFSGVLSGTAAAQAPAEAPSKPSKVEFRFQERVGTQLEADLLTSKQATALAGVKVSVLKPAACSDAAFPFGETSSPYTQCTVLYTGQTFGQRAGRVIISAYLQAFGSTEEASAYLAWFASTRAPGTTIATPTEAIWLGKSGRQVDAVTVFQVSGATVSGVGCTKSPRASRVALTTCARKGAQAQLSNLAG